MPKHEVKPVVSVVYSSRKGGHKFPAEALTSFLRTHHGPELDTRLVNVLDHSPLASWLDRVGRLGDLYLREAWKMGYSQLEQQDSPFLEVYRRGVPLVLGNPVSRERILGAIGKPDLIVSIQPEMNCLLPALRPWNGTRIHTAIIDYSVHGLWIHDAINQYYVANSKIADKVAGFGVPRSRIRVTGIPLREAFSKVTERSVEEQRQALGWDQHLPAICVLGGFLGTMVDYPAVIRSFSQIRTPHQLVVVFGKNEAARQESSDLIERSEWPVHSYGAVSNMAELMWASDVIASKPGSVTIGEALALGKPIILIDPKAGSAQELVFSKFVSDAEAGVRAPNSSIVGPITDGLLSRPERFRAMTERAAELGAPNRTACQTIAQRILEALDGPL